MENIHVIFNEISCSSWTERCWEKQNVHGCVCGRDQVFLGIVQKLVLENYDKTLKVEVIDSNGPYLSEQQQKSTCSQIPSYVFGKFLNKQKRWREMERIADGNSDNSLLNNFTESMESHLSSGVILSQDLRHWNCFDLEKFEDRIVFMSIFNGIDENTMNLWFSSNSWISAFFQVLFRVRIDCMVNSAAVSFHFQASASSPTFKSRHRATYTRCRIFRSLAQLPCHGRPRCCSRSDILVPLLGVRNSVVLNKAFFLIIGTGSHRSCFISHSVIFGSEYPRAWRYRRRWRRWWPRTAPRYQISDWLRSGDDTFIVITLLLSFRHGLRVILRTELRAPLRAEKAYIE